jgi:hypothetical protein
VRTILDSHELELLEDLAVLNCGKKFFEDESKALPGNLIHDVPQMGIGRRVRYPKKEILGLPFSDPAALSSEVSVC